MSFWVIQLLGILSLGALLFLLASGLTMVFGLMRIINLAHGSFYMLAAYLAMSFMASTGSFSISLIAASLVVTVLGTVLYVLLIQRLVGQYLRQILLTFGLLLIMSDVALIVWHGALVLLEPPAALAGTVAIGGGRISIYRLFVIGVGLVLAIALGLFQERTRVGAMVRAGADDAEMLSCMGYNVGLIFLGVFALGSLLAAISGVLGSVFLGSYPGIDLELGILAFVVVIIGGLGSVNGTFVASLLVATIDNLAKALLPEISLFAIFLLMIAVLAVKPSGLFVRSAR